MLPARLKGNRSVMLTIAGDQKANSAQGAKPKTATGKRNGNERLPPPARSASSSSVCSTKMQIRLIATMNETGRAGDQMPPTTVVSPIMFQNLDEDAVLASVRP